MISTRLHPQDVDKQKSLLEAALLDTPTDPYLQSLARVAQDALCVKTVLISLVDHSKYWSASSLDWGITPTSEEIFCAEAILQNTFVWMEDASKDPSYAQHPLVNDPSGVRFFAIMPLVTSSGNTVGSFAVADKAPRAKNDMLLAKFKDLALLAEGYLNMVQLKKQARRIKDAFEKAQRKALIDPLTQAWNRAGLERFYAVKQHESLSEGRLLTVLYCDIDHFKAVNDKHGHACGDIVLKECASRISKVLGSGDILVRYGGEEFVILSVQNDTTSLTSLCDRIHHEMLSSPFVTASANLTLTVSIGATATGCAQSLDALLAVADNSLYQAKSNGRNRTIYGPRLPESNPGLPLSNIH